MVLYSKQEMGFMKISLRWGLSWVKVVLWFGSLGGGGLLAHVKATVRG
jgi:hypothetical protein